MEEINLISKYKQNTSINMDEMVKDYSKYMYKVIKNMTSYLSNEDIEEVILDVFLIIWNNRYKLKDELPIKPYIIGITKNIVRNKCKNASIIYNLEDYQDVVEDSIDIQSLLEQKEKNKIIKKALDSMKEIDRNIFILFYYNSMNISQIANKLGISKVNTKTKLYRIRKKLKKFLIQGGYNNGR